MKIDVTHIVRSHLGTLRDEGEARLSREDFLLFFILPALAAVVAFFVGLRIDQGAFGVSISAFAIFAALLLNVQIALFSILQREWTPSDDANIRAIQKEKRAERRELLREVNTNISYLIVISCIAITVFLLFYVLKPDGFFAQFVSTYIYVHFVLSLLMVIKRSHALFQKEYETAD